MNQTAKPGLSGGALKLLALGTMLLDHIGEIFGIFGAPLWLRYLGRLSAPIFFVMFVEGVTHTHDKKRYFLRIYAIAVGMRLVELVGPALLPRQDGWFPPNAIFSTFAVLVVMIAGLEWIGQKRPLGWLLLLLPVAIGIVFLQLPQEALWAQIAHCFLPDALFCEGGYGWVGFGLLMYGLRKNRTVQLVALAAFFLLITGSAVLAQAQAYAVSFGFWGALRSAALYGDYQWMAAFAAIPLAFYNGERGRLPKNLFYIFYPAHIYLLYFISWIIY